MRSNGKPAVVQGEFDDSGPIEPSGDAALMLRSGSAIQRTQTAYSTAISVQKPRDLKKVKAAVLIEAELAGQDFFYSWSTNNRDGSRGLVEGISIDGAMILARNWFNCAIPTELVVDAPQHWIIQATFVDLETGFNVPRLFRQRKNQTAGGKMDADRAMDIAFQIGQSKAQRNAVDKAMPEWLVRAAMEKAKAAAEGAFSDVAAANKEALAHFARWHVSQAQLEEKLGLKIELWTAHDHVSLRGLLRALRDRQTTVAAEFPSPEAKAAAEQAEQTAQSEKTAQSGYGPVEATGDTAGA